MKRNLESRKQLIANIKMEELILIASNTYLKNNKTIK